MYMYDVQCTINDVHSSAVNRFKIEYTYLPKVQLLCRRKVVRFGTRTAPRTLSFLLTPLCTSQVLDLDEEL